MLLTPMVVAKLWVLGLIEPTLMTGMLIEVSRVTLPPLTLKDVITMVLVPWCIGNTLKNLPCLLTSETRNIETLQFRARSILPSFLTIEVANYRWTRLSTSIVTCRVWLDPRVVVEWESEKPSPLVTVSMCLWAPVDIRLGSAKECEMAETEMLVLWVILRTSAVTVVFPCRTENCNIYV